MSTERPEAKNSKSVPPQGRGESSAPADESAVNAGDLDQPPDGGEPDLSLDSPVLNVAELELEAESLQARAALSAELAGFVKIEAGVTSHLKQVKLSTKGVEAQTLLKINLERVLETIDRALDAIDRNPQLLNGPVDQTPGSSRKEQPPATGAARRLAEQLDVDPATVVGTGSGGRITVKDVRKAAKNGE